MTDKTLYKIQNLSKNSYIIPSGATSKVISLPLFIIKYVVNYKEYNVYEREKHLESILNKFDWYPELLYSDDINQVLIFKNVGVPLTNQNKPDNMEEQINKILFDMESVNVQHNDIKLGELLIDEDNKIYLCDFGWASINNEIGCGIGLWNCKNTDKPGGYFEDATCIQRLLLNRNNTMSTITEMHILIDWTCHFDDMKKKINFPLEIVNKICIQKLDNKKAIISNFYKTLVDDFRGSTNFNLYILKDKNPIYDYRKTSKGYRKVNVNVFDLKKSLRNITGGHKIHATDNIQETKDNLKDLGLYNKFYKEKKFDKLQDVFEELNKYPNLKWVVMRNFEGMPDNITIDEHLDIDLLVSDYYLAKTILDGTSATNNRYEDGKYRILNYVKINNKNVLFDLRSLGDNYYDIKLQQDMLDTRVKHPSGFYIPNKEMHLYSLIYHAIIHKKIISDTYINVFKQYGFEDSEINRLSLKNKLDKWLEEKNYSYCKPEPSVGYFV